MNQCNFIGTLGRDADVKTLEGGKSVINFSIAVNEGYGDKKTTLWISCAKWGEKTAVAQYLTKGSKVAVSGQVGIRTYKGKDGSDKSEMTIKVNELHLIGSKSDAEYSEPTASKPVPVTEDGGVTMSDEPKDDLPF